MTFIERNKTGLLQYANYSLIGTSCAVLDLLTLNMLLVLVPTSDATLLLIFNTLAYTATVTNSYYWNAKFTFKVKKCRKQLLPFTIQAIISLLIANMIFIGGVWLLDKLPVFAEWVDINLAKGLSMYVSFQVSFFFNKYFVFNK